MNLTALSGHHRSIYHPGLKSLPESGNRFAVNPIDIQGHELKSDLERGRDMKGHLLQDRVIAGESWIDDGKISLVREIEKVHLCLQHGCR